MVRCWWPVVVTEAAGLVSREQSIPELMTLTSSNEAVIVMHPAAASSQPRLRITYHCEEASSMHLLSNGQKRARATKLAPPARSALPG